MDKDQWIREAAEALTERHKDGKPLSAKEKNNFLDWASTLAEGKGSYYEEGFSPAEAVKEELSYA